MIYKSLYEKSYSRFNLEQLFVLHYFYHLLAQL